MIVPGEYHLGVAEAIGARQPHNLGSYSPVVSLLRNSQDPHQTQAPSKRNV